jgi:hypothetical protein
MLCPCAIKKKTIKTLLTQKEPRKQIKKNISNWHELRSYADSPLAKPVNELPLLPLDFHQSLCDSQSRNLKLLSA